MSTQTFFEFLSISNQEKIHSQILSWIFSENFKGILHTEKIKLFKNLFNIDVKKIEFSLTEYKNVDILIKTDKDIVVIENKLKSSQHSNQLDKYQKTIDNDFNNIKTNYFFLTLIGESSINTNWKNISYNDLFIALKKIEFQKNKDAIILEEYLAFLSKLVSVFEDFKSNYSKYPSVFQNGSLKKIDKLTFNYPSKNEEFIGKNQLETIFQKNLLNKILNSLKTIEIQSNVSETRGSALIDINLDSFKFENKHYNIFLQLQSENIKFAIASNHYSTSNKLRIKPFYPLFEDLKQNNSFGYNKINKPKTKAYISLSKKTSSNYWDMDYDTLLIFIKNELTNSKILSNEFRKLLKQYGS